MTAWVLALWEWSGIGSMDGFGSRVLLLWSQRARSLPSSAHEAISIILVLPSKASGQESAVNYAKSKVALGLLGCLFLLGWNGVTMLPSQSQWERPIPLGGIPVTFSTSSGTNAATPTVVTTQRSASFESDGTIGGVNGSYSELIPNTQGYVYDEIRVRRDRFIIYVEMVKRLSGSSLNLTELSLLTGLNFGMTKACVDYLMSAGLVRAELEKGIRYSATARGRSFLEDSQKALSYLNEQEKKLK